MVRVEWQVKLCYAFVTRGLYLSAIELYHYKVLYKFTLVYLLCLSCTSYVH